MGSSRKKKQPRRIQRARLPRGQQRHAAQDRRIPEREFAVQQALLDKSLPPVVLEHGIGDKVVVGKGDAERSGLATPRLKCEQHICGEKHFAANQTGPKKRAITAASAARAMRSARRNAVKVWPSRQGSRQS